MNVFAIILVASVLTPQPGFEKDGYNWMARHRHILAEQTKINPEIVMIGDSITHNWAGRQKDCIGGTDALPHWKKTFEGRRVLNMGFGFDRICNVMWRLENGELKGTDPEYVVIHVGGNNFIGSKKYKADKPEEVAEGVVKIAEKVHEIVPKAKIVVMAIFPFGYTPGERCRVGIAAANKELAKKIAALKYVTYLDITSKQLRADGIYPGELTKDSIHPTEKGYDIWSAALKPILKLK